MELSALREQIDAIDEKLIALFCRRMEIAAGIAQYKKENNMPVLMPKREEEKLAQVAKKASSEMGEYTQELFKTLFSLSREYQHRQLEKGMQCGLLGRTLGHSFSPMIHSHLGSYRYDKFEVEPEQLADFLKNGSFAGLNVTIPYKKDVIPYCAELSDRAKKLGAVNTLVKRSDGSLIGHNTDYFGFVYMLRQCGISPKGKKVLVLGSGGASNTAVAALEELGANVVVISRQGENNYQNLEKHSDCAILVNTTPVGTYPNVGISPVDLDVFNKLEAVLDVIYNPARTKLLLDAETRKIPCCNGLWMLVGQAKEAGEWFTGKIIDDQKIPEIYKKIRKNTDNICLVGMPGCGKSTVCKCIAQKLGRKFVDADAAIEEAAGMTIPEIFAKQGEHAFRKLEMQVLAQLGKESGLVIATGGGCVTRQENYNALHQNGTIIWLKRELELLPTQGRPLSSKEGMAKMYEVRKPLYEAFSDLIVENRDTPETAADAIIQAWEEIL